MDQRSAFANQLLLPHQFYMAAAAGMPGAGHPSLLPSYYPLALSLASGHQSQRSHGPSSSATSLPSPPFSAALVGEGVVAPTPHYPSGAALASLLDNKYNHEYLESFSVAGGGAENGLYPGAAKMIKDVFFTDAMAGDMAFPPAAGTEEVSLQSIFDVERLSPPSSPSRFERDDCSSLFGYDLDTCSTVCGSPLAEDYGYDRKGSVGSMGDGSLGSPTEVSDTTSVCFFDGSRVMTPPLDESDPLSPFDMLPGSTPSETADGLLDEQPAKRRRLGPGFPSAAHLGGAFPIQTVSPYMLMHPLSSAATAVAASDEDSATASDEYGDDSGSSDESCDEYVPQVVAAVPGRRSVPAVAPKALPRLSRTVSAVVPSASPLAATKAAALVPRSATPEPRPAINGILPENLARTVTQARVTRRPTLYETMSNESIDWCRYCGTTEGINWRPGPWGKRTLCNKHGCDYKGYGFACKLPRLDLRAYARESIEQRDRPILQLFCTVCHDPQSYEGNVMVRCEGCPKAFHQHCVPVPISDEVAASTEPWFCDAGCPANCRAKRVVVELPRKRLPLMCSPKANAAAQALATDAPTTTSDSTPAQREASPSPARATSPRLTQRVTTDRRRRRSSGPAVTAAQLPPSPSPSVDDTDGACDGKSEKSECDTPTPTRTKPASRKRKLAGQAPALPAIPETTAA
ncbi:hypothetical protein H4R33_007002 [Dimargaris cristalligena]|nr:hypothetical protein H4R33_007002 [Dimargaris cristalligena]